MSLASIDKYQSSRLDLARHKIKIANFGDNDDTEWATGFLLETRRRNIRELAKPRFLFVAPVHAHNLKLSLNISRLTKIKLPDYYVQFCKKKGVLCKHANARSRECE